MSRMPAGRSAPTTHRPGIPEPPVSPHTEKIMSPDTTDPREKHIADLHAGIRQIAHDLSNPLGILRMAVYFLQSTKAEGEKREQYLTMMNETIDRVEQQLKRLRDLTEGRKGGNDPGGEGETGT